MIAFSREKKGKANGDDVVFALFSLRMQSYITVYINNMPKRAPNIITPIGWSFTLNNRKANTA